MRHVLGTPSRTKSSVFFNIVQTGGSNPCSNNFVADFVLWSIPYSPWCCKIYGQSCIHPAVKTTMEGPRECYDSFALMLDNPDNFDSMFPHKARCDSKTLKGELTRKVIYSGLNFSEDIKPPNPSPILIQFSSNNIYKKVGDFDFWNIFKCNKSQSKNIININFSFVCSPCVSKSFHKNLHLCLERAAWLDPKPSRNPETIKNTQLASEMEWLCTFHIGWPEAQKPI